MLCFCYNCVVYPVVWITPGNQRVPVGTSVEFTCMSNSSDGQITWSRTDGQSLQLHAVQTGNRLIFNVTQEGNSGSYTCSITNAAGIRTSNVILNAYRKYANCLLLICVVYILRLSHFFAASFTCNYYGKA